MIADGSACTAAHVLRSWPRSPRAGGRGATKAVWPSDDSCDCDLVAAGSACTAAHVLRSWPLSATAPARIARVKSCCAAATPPSGRLTRIFARLDEAGDSSLARNQYHQQDRDAATEATSKNVQNRNDHARIYSPRKRQRAVQTRIGAGQRRTALHKYLGWGDRHTLHTAVASSRAGVRCGTQLVRTGHPACSILHWGRNFPTKS